MYSGNDSTEAQNYTQWALNPSAYQNMSNDQVDWAALAQQWIIMKEAGPPVPEQITNNVPPPSRISKPSKKDVPVEGGEAPMEVENDAEDVPPQWNDGGGSGDSWSWNQQPPSQQQQPPPAPQQQQQQTWGWGNSWSAPSGVPPPNSVKTPLLPTPPAYNQYSSNDNCNDNSNYGYTSAPPSSDYQSGYWTSPPSSSKVIKPHNKRYSKVNVPTAVAAAKPVTIDAAKRKQLPAWIREGLEKMERDKLKQLDREREKLEKEEYEAKMKLSEKHAMEILKTAVKEQQKSKFESDADDSGDDTDGRPLTPEPVPLSQEELMLKVRHTMTEILLKVTNREIYSICREELQRHLKKLKASDQRVSAPSGANLSAKLGLGAYGGSGSSSDSSDDEPNKDHPDSDADLKDTIKRRKAEFVKTEREIEDKLAETEHDGEDSRAVSPDNSDKDSQVDAKISGGRGRLNSFDKTPPLKPSQNSKRKPCRRSSSSDDDSDSDLERNSRSKDRRTRDRRSSSTLSSRSDKYNKRSRSSWSRTPEQKHQKYSESDRKSKYSESKSSRRSRSKSPSTKRRRSRSPSAKRNSRRNSRYSKRSHTRSQSRSSSRSRQRSSYERFRSARSTSRSRRSSSRSYISRRRRSHSRQRSRSPVSHRHRRSRSHSNGRGKRSHRH